MLFKWKEGNITTDRITPFSGHRYFKDHFSKLPAATKAQRIKEIGDAALLTPNHAIFIYDFLAPQLLYARGFEMLGFNDATITILDVFNSAIPEQREACGEISGKALAAVKQTAIQPLKNGIILNYAGQSVSGEKVHLMLESAVFDLNGDGIFASTMVTLTKLAHLPLPKIVRWAPFGEMENQLLEYVDDGLIQPNRISSREAEVLRNLAAGYTMTQTANALSISSRTVEQHIVNMRQRFDCTNISQLVAFGKDMGLI